MTGLGELFLAFVAAINAHDVPKIGEMMTADHVFVDSLGNTVTGGRAMQNGWNGYFALFPDYRIDVDHVSVSGNDVLASGWASGTLHQDGKPVSDGYWRIPAAWRAKIRDGKLSGWQVYADNKPVYELLARQAKP
jgi:ketosteroid isomerase-like protein